MDDINWKEFFGSIAVISNVLQFFTGSVDCHKYIRNKSTGESSSLPFNCGFLACTLWMCYALVVGDSSIWLVNVIGTALFLMYLVVFYVFTESKASLVRVFVLSLLVLLVCVGYIQQTQPIADAKLVVGLLCSIVSVLFFAAPLSMLLHVIRVKNSESLPFSLIASTFFVSLQWLIYGVLIDDAYVEVTNFLGCLLSGTQLLLFVIYPSRSFGSGPAYNLVDDSFTF